jgi:hypothetical protein
MKQLTKEQILKLSISDDQKALMLMKLKTIKSGKEVVK